MIVYSPIQEHTSSDLLDSDEQERSDSKNDQLSMSVDICHHFGITDLIVSHMQLADTTVTLQVVFGILHNRCKPLMP